MKNKENYRPNVAIIIVNRKGKILWCKRKDGNGWQFPQGGLDPGESPKEAIYRETKEEVGLDKEDIGIIKESEGWFNYKVPKNRIPKYFRISDSKFVGQTQKWFLAEILCEDSKINLNASSPVEFEDWTWSSYWHPINGGVDFKKSTYRKVLKEFLPYYHSFVRDFKA